MDSHNLQIKCAKAIRLPQDLGHMLRLILANHSQGRNRRKTLQIARTKIEPKIPPKIKKLKNILAHRER
jgi:hypothetical protein